MQLIHQPDILIVGAGPVGLFTIFEAGLMRFRCHVVDSTTKIGGQLTEIYPRKPIYDIPGLPFVLAQDLVDNLMKQAMPFKPRFTLGERVDNIERTEDGQFIVTSDKKTQFRVPIVILAGGLGSFEPRKPKVPCLDRFEKTGAICYKVIQPEKYLGHHLLISGGGDSALDWALYFANKRSTNVTLVHRNSAFRAQKNSVEQLLALSKSGSIKLFTEAEVVSVKGNEQFEGVEIKPKDKKAFFLKADYWLPLFGFVPKTDQLTHWGLNIKNNAIEVDPTANYSTNIRGIYAVGDINTYPNKLKLILCGFHEATMAVQDAYKILHPQKKYTMKYTTVQGIKGF